MHLNAPLLFVGLVSLACACAHAQDQLPLLVKVPLAEPPPKVDFKMGTATNPKGETITVDSRTLFLSGKRWAPAMGEYHFARYPANEWRGELLKMKAGGIEIVATYVFWIHHEEIEGQFDWSERRNLHGFLAACKDVGLKAIVRSGPWCHGEARNGGQPDWLLAKGWKLRSDDTNYLEKVKILYGEIARQMQGLLWKDGGPVIGVQFENEFWGPSAHLLNLKQIARDAGMDVPLYTRTGWPLLKDPIALGEILPLYGVYAEGFWDREMQPMPGRYWAGFHFSLLRTDANIANELLGRRDAKDPDDVALYPYLTCEIGGGMMNSYHRRIYVDPDDVVSTTLVKLGSGSTSPGYYMYHGGVNPEGKLSTLNESQATKYPNDLPVKSYDFQAPLGEYGQVRPHYHGLRRLHLFLQDCGSSFAAMPPYLPEIRPSGKEDTTTLRWCVRSDGARGYIFVNNFERLQHLPPKNNVRFNINLHEGALEFPSQPFTVPAGAYFFVPFNMELSPGITLSWATAQPVCAITNGNTKTFFFAQINGVSAEFAFPESSKAESRTFKAHHEEGRTLFRDVRSSLNPFVLATARDGSKVQLVLLSEPDSMVLWKGHWLGKARAFLAAASLVMDNDTLRLQSELRSNLKVSIYPAPERLTSDSEALRVRHTGLFTEFTPRLPAIPTAPASPKLVRAAGPAREIPLSTNKWQLPVAPDDADFNSAAVWRVQSPAKGAFSNALLRFSYVGDVARISIRGKLVTDDFYNGKPVDLGIWRHASLLTTEPLEIAILPLRKDSPVYMPEAARKSIGAKDSKAELLKAEFIPLYTVNLKAAGGVSQSAPSLSTK